MAVASPSSILYLTEKDVQQVLNWNDLITTLEENFSDVSSVPQVTELTTLQPPRIVMHIPHRSGIFITMPGLSERKKVLACKLVTVFFNNSVRFNIPNILANIALFNPDTGELSAILQATTITEWRTAAASVVATKYLKPGDKQVLAVFGAGRQGRIHIIAFKHYFKIKKINLWNRSMDKAQKLAEELKKEFNINVQVFSNARNCAGDADVIVTATATSEPILKYEYLKPTAMINAIGVGRTHHSELDKNIYEQCAIYVDSMESANKELKGLIEEGYNIAGEIGQVINGKKVPITSGIIVSHTLGMATADAVAAGLVLEKYLKKQKT